MAKSSMRYLPHYFAMSLYILSGVIAFQVPSYGALILCIVGVIIAYPAFLFPERIRWSFLLLIFLGIYYFFSKIEMLAQAAAS